MIGYHAAAGLASLKFHQVVLDSGCGEVAKFISCRMLCYSSIQPPADTLFFVMVEDPTDQYNHQTKCGKNMLAIVVFSVSSALNDCQLQCSSSHPFVTNSRYATWQELLSFHHYFVLMARNWKIKFFALSFPASILASNWSANNLPHRSK